MADDLLAFEDLPLQVSHILTPSESVTLSSLSVVLTDLETGSALTPAPTVNQEPYDGPDALEGTFDKRVWFDWTPANPGDVQYLIRGTMTPGAGFQFQGQILVWPQFSKLDRYLRRIQGWVQETEIGEGQQRLGRRDYRDALAAAVRVYERDRPREVVTRYALESGTQEYDLPGEEAEDTEGEVFSPPAPWVNQFSRFLTPQFPQNYTSLTPLYPVPQISVDWRRGKWRFVSVYPPYPTDVDLPYTTRHTLSHTADSLPEEDFEAITQYAAGKALQTLANQATWTEAPEIGGGLVSYRDQTQRLRQQAKDMMEGAKALWTPQPVSSPRRQTAGTLCLESVAGERARRQDYTISNYGD